MTNGRKFSFKKVSGKKNFKGWKEWQEGEYVIGTYVEKVAGYKGSTENPNYVVEVIESSDENIKEGTELVLNHVGILKYHMERKASIGDVIKVEYLGKEPMRDDPSVLAHQIDLYVDSSNNSSSIPEAPVEEVEDDFGL